MSGPMGLTYPVQGDTTDTWGTVLNALLSLVENHDHSSGKGNQIPSSALGINADVSWASFAITALKGLAFTEEAASSLTSYSRALFVNSADHNLYFRNGSGVNVQVTSGNTLNVSIVGGIGGDYSSVNALLSYDDATKRYLLQQEGSPRPWAGLATADIDLYEKAASIVNKVTLKSPGSLAASYTLTMPTAAPSATKVLTVDNTGQLAYGTGLFLGVQSFTANGTYTPTSGAKTVLVRMVGGGGGGGGAVNPALNGCGGGGASGVYVEFTVTAAAITGGAVTIGAAGTTGSGVLGGTGGDTVIIVNGTTYTAKGGIGGAVGGDASSGKVAGGGIQVGSSTGIVSFAEVGGPGRWSGTAGTSGKGGSTPFGAGGPEVGLYTNAPVNGAAGNGYGAGGSGACSTNTTGAATGGAATGGLIVIQEFA